MNKNKSAQASTLEQSDIIIPCTRLPNQHQTQIHGLRDAKEEAHEAEIQPMLPGKN